MGLLNNTSKEENDAKSAAATYPGETRTWFSREGPIRREEENTAKL